MNILITGIRGNLGSAVAEYFVSRGQGVYGSVLFEKELSSDKENIKTFIADLESENGAKQFVESVVKLSGNIDVAVLTVGGWQPGNLEQTSHEDLKKQITLNFYTAYNVVRFIFPLMMKRGGGKIILIGAQPGLHPEKGKDMVGYTLSKSLIFSFAKMLNSITPIISTIVIVPSTIDTPQNRKAMPKADTSKWVKAETIASTIGDIVDDRKKVPIVEW